jgi:hypothetical protein
MTIYPDASFLVSWLYRPDPLNGRARVWFANHQADDFLISDWARFETVNTLRDLCLRPHPPGITGETCKVRSPAGWTAAGRSSSREVRAYLISSAAKGLLTKPPGLETGVWG